MDTSLRAFGRMPKHTLPGTDRLPSIGPNFSVPRATPDTFSGFRSELETRTPLLVAVTLYFRARKRLRIERVTGIARRVSSIYSRGAVGRSSSPGNSVVGIDAHLVRSKRQCR